MAKSTICLSFSRLAPECLHLLSTVRLKPLKPNVLRGKQQDALAVKAVASGSSRLLVVALHIFGIWA